MNKWRNYGLWAALLLYQSVLLGILVLVGIISNPEKGKWFKEEEETKEDEEDG